MSDQALTPHDRESIRNIGEHRWTRALESGDVDTLVGLCTEDLVYMPADHPPLRGRDQFRAWLNAFPKVVRMAQPITAIDGAGNVAMVEATFDVTIEVNGQQIESSGKAMCQLRKAASGEWLVKSVCWNFDRPMGPLTPA
jgi:ketosteroid isomerase-like protein